MCMCVLYTYVYVCILGIRLTSEFYCHNYHSSQLSLSVELQFGSFGLPTCSFIYSIIQKSLIGITIYRKFYLLWVTWLDKKSSGTCRVWFFKISVRVSLRYPKQFLLFVVHKPLTAYFGYRIWRHQAGTDQHASYWLIIFYNTRSNYTCCCRVEKSYQESYPAVTSKNYSGKIVAWMY